MTSMMDASEDDQSYTAARAMPAPNAAGLSNGVYSSINLKKFRTNCLPPTRVLWTAVSSSSSMPHAPLEGVAELLIPTARAMLAAAARLPLYHLIHLLEVRGLVDVL